jgi:hypothetical protein
MTTLSDLAAGQLFIGVPEVASITGRDERTIRRAVEKAEIPGQKVGANWMIPVAWIRQQAGVAESAAAGTPALDELADQVAARVLARLARLLAQAGDGS